MTSITASNDRTSVSIVPALLVVFAAGQSVSSALSGLLAPQPLESGPAVSPLVPPGPWFAIWAVIIAVSTLWAIVAFRRSVRFDPVRRRIGAGLLVTSVGFSAWLTAAAFGQSTPVTVPILAVMIAGLAVAARYATINAAAVNEWPVFDRGLLWSCIGFYLGWTSMALWVNLATVLQAAGAPTDGAYGTIWQTGILGLALATAVGMIVLTRGSVIYAATVLYALIGVAISTWSTGYSVLASVALAGCAIVIAATAATRLLRRRASRRELPTFS